jgi:hypothetical protein
MFAHKFYARNSIFYVLCKKDKLIFVNITITEHMFYFFYTFHIKCSFSRNLCENVD